jgi:8-oxo-dGTP pyrophosphatase MutT (NUDIX family)
MTDAVNPWTTLRSERRFDDAFIAVDEDRVIDPAGHESSYGVVRFKNKGLKILAVDADGCTFLVQQYRYGAGYLSWELPAGNEEPGEDDQAGAARELGEEVGQTAMSWLALCELVPSGSVTDQRDKVFLAWHLTPRERDLDEQERIRVKRLPFQSAVQMALSGEIADSGSVAGLLSLRVRADRGELPDDLRQLLA